MSKTYLKILIASLIFLLTGVAPYSSAWALPGDIDESGRVDGFDLITFSRAYDSTDGDAHWNPRADLNRDGTVDDADLAILRDYFGKTGVSQNCWVADEYNSQVVKLAGGTGEELVRTASGGLSYPRDVWANPSDGSCWVGDKGNDRIVRFSAKGQSGVTVLGFSAPQSIVADPVRNIVWIADTSGNRIIRLNGDVHDGYDISQESGFHTTISGFGGPLDVSVNTTDGSCWVADTNNNRVVKIYGDVSGDYDVESKTGYHLVATGFSSPSSVSVDHIAGSCWVADSNNDQVVKLSADGFEEYRIDGFDNPNSVSVNPLTGCCWVSDRDHGEVVKLSSSGAELVRVTGFNAPNSVSVDVVKGDCWVADRANHQIVKLAVNGQELLRISGFSYPASVAAVPPGKGEEPPAARAVVSSNQVEVGESITFDGSQSTDYLHNIIKYEWDFDGDGVFDFSSPNPIANHSYEKVGTYVAILSVTNDIWLTDTTHTELIQVGQLTAIAEADPLTGTAPLSVTFTFDAIDPVDGRVQKFLWDFDGNGVFEIELTSAGTTVHEYEDAGTYIAVMKVIDEGNVTDTIEITIEVTKTAPSAAISVNTDQGAGPLQVDFTGTGHDPDGTIVFYEWDFDGDGQYNWFNHSHGNASTLYPEPGTYTAILRVTDNDGNQSASSRVIIVTPPPPVARISLSPEQGNAPLTINFDGTGSTSPCGAIVGYTWDFGDGQTATVASGTLEYTQAGTYTVSLTVTDDLSGTGTATGSIRVLPAGTPTAVASADPYTGIVPLTVDFSAAGSSDPNGTIVLYEWDFEGAFEDDMESGSGNWTAQDPWAIIDSDAHSGTHCWTDSPSGDYADLVNTSLVTRSFDLTNSTEVTLIFWHHYAFTSYGKGIVEISTAGSDTYTEMTYFSGTQDDWTRASVDLSTYAGESVRIRFRLYNEHYYNADGWYIDDVAIEGGMGAIDSQDVNASYTYNQPGIYHPILRVTDDDGFTSTESVKIVVLSRPQPRIAQPQSGISCFKQDVNFAGEGTDADGEIVLYEWDFDGNGTFDWSSTTTGVTLYSFTSPGIYTATFRVTDNSGLEESSSVSFQVIEKAPVDVEPTADTTHGNAPLDVSFDGSARDEDGSVVRYEWDFDGDGTYDWGSAGPGQVVSFSSQYNTSNWSAANLIDGVVATNDSRGWCSVYNAGFPQEIVFSLAEGNIWNIQRLDIDPQTTESSARWAKNFQLFASTTGLEEGDFTAIAEGATFTLTNQAGFQTFTFTAMPAKYVKMLITSNYGHGNYTQLGEVAVFSGILNVLSPLSAASGYTYDSAGTYGAVLRATDDEGFQTTETIQVQVLSSDRIPAMPWADPSLGYTPLAVEFAGDRLDEFEGNTIDSVLWRPAVGGGSWVEEGGLLKQTNNAGSADTSDIYGTYIVTRGAAGWDDYQFSSDLYSTDNDDMGLIFRFQDESQYYLFHWNNEKSYRKLVKRSQGGVDVLAEDSVPYTQNHWHNVKVEANGSQLQVYVDDDLVFDVTDDTSPYLTGGVGLWCNYNDDTYFDSANLKWSKITQYEWDFDGDGTDDYSSAASGSTTYTYTVPGTYQARLRITDDQTRTDTDTVEIKVLPKGMGFARAWVTDRNHDKIVLLAADGETVIKEVTGFNDPIFVAVNPSDGTCWVSDYNGHKIFRIDGENVTDGYNVSSESGYHMAFTGFSYPHDLEVDKRDGACWVTDRNHDQVVKLAGDGSGELVRISGFSNPQSVAVNGTDGVFWVVDDGYDKVYRFDPDVPDGYDIASDTGSHIEIGGFYNPVHAAVDENDGSCWVADQWHHQVVKLSSDGSTELLRISGFDDPTRVAVNQEDGSAWVADRDHHQVVHLSADGSLELARAGGFSDIYGLSVDSQTGQCWVTDIGYNHEDLKRLSPNRTQLSRKGGFYDPYDVAVISGEDSPENQNPPTASASADAYTGTTPLQVNFTGSASDNGSVVLYEWDFEGDGTFDYESSTSAAVTYTYTQHGYYQPVLRVTDNDGLVDYVHLSPVRVGHLTAEISASVTQGVGPLQVNFTASGFDPNGRITEYAWDFGGDGTYDATGASVDHTFQTQGSYSVVLRATGPSGTVYDAVIITVIPSPPTATATVTPDSGAPPLKIHLDGQASDADGSIVIYQWDYDGDGIFDWSSRTVDNTYFTYAQTGVYTATFRVIDNEGFEVTASKTITVNTPPEAAFEATPVKGNEPLEVTFDASSSFDHDSGDSIVSYEWDFGDGESDTGMQVNHTYQSAGTYQATLTVSDTFGGVGQATASAAVKPAGTPTAVAEASPLTGTAPLTVQFVADGSSDDLTITLYDWDFDEGFRLNENGYPTHQLFLGTWASTGCGDVTSMREGILEVEPNEGDLFSGKTWFAASDSDGNFSWDGVFGNHSNSYAYSHIYVYSSTQQNVLIKFGADDAARFWVNGTLAYEKTACEGVSIDKYSFEVTLNEGWNSILASVSEGGGGWGLAYRFTDTDGNALRLFYSLNKLTGDPDFFYSSDTTGNTSHIYHTPGAYEATLTVTDNDGNTDCAAIEVTVLTPGAPLANASADPLAGDNPLAVHFVGTGSDSNGSIVLYEWDFDGDGSFDWSSDESGESFFTYEDVGTYQAVLRVTDNDGYTATDQITISAGICPEARPYAYPLTGQAPLTVNFTSNGYDEDGTIVRFEWDLNGDGEVESLGDLNGDGWPDNPSQISTAFPYTYNQPGTYNAKLTVTDNDGLKHSAILQIVVQIPQGPLAMVEAEPEYGDPPLEVTFRGYGTDRDGTISQYEWDFGDGTTASGQLVNHTYDQPGVYKAVLTVTDSDGSTGSASVYVRVKEEGDPTAIAGADPGAETSSFTVHFAGSGTDEEGDITLYEWDFDGDGIFDYSSTVLGDIVHNYTLTGQYEASLRVTDEDGNQDIDYVTIDVGFGIKAGRATEIFDPTLNETARINYSLTSPASLTLRILDRQYNTVRTVIQENEHEPGAYVAVWDGKDDHGEVVPAGVYYFIIDYQVNGATRSLDLTGDVSLARRTPAKNYPDSFNTLEDRPLFVKYRLDKPSETTIYVAEWLGGGLYVGERIKTLLLREPRPGGDYVTIWDGTDDEGNIAPVGTYVWTVMAYDLPDNAIIVHTKPVIEDVSKEPDFYMPAANPYAVDPGAPLTVSFRLSKPATVDAFIKNENNVTVRTLTPQFLQAGVNQLTWDGRDDTGNLVYPGTFRIGIKATDEFGNESTREYALFRVFY